MTESARRNLFLALCVLALWHTGASFSQSYVNYPGWYVIEPESFKAYHGPMSVRAAIVLMAPRLLELGLALAVLRYRPRAIGGWVIASGAALALVGILSTLLISRPIHAELDVQGNTPQLVARLMAADWVRNIAGWLRAALYVWALSRLINTGTITGGEPLTRGA